MSFTDTFDQCHLSHCCRYSLSWPLCLLLQARLVLAFHGLTPPRVEEACPVFSTLPARNGWRETRGRPLRGCPYASPRRRMRRAYSCLFDSIGAPEFLRLLSSSMNSTRLHSG